MAAKKMTPKTGSIEDDIRKRYKAPKGSLVNSRGSSAPGAVGPVGRKEYVQTFQDVVAESPLASRRGWEAAAAKIATEQWNKTFGPKKGMTGVKAPKGAETISKSKRVMPAKKAMPASVKKKTK